MEELKERVFQFGIYGEKLLSLSRDEIEMIVDEPWAEITTMDAIKNLKTEFTTNSLRSNTNRFMMENFDPSFLCIRMGTLAWKDYLTSDCVFNFTSKEYFLIMDFLIRIKDYVDNVQLRSLGLDPKKTHYCINRLTKKGFIEYKSADSEERKGFMYKVRVVVNERGFITKNLIHGNANADESGGEDLRHLFEYKLDMGLYDNVRGIILNSADGVTTEDLKNRLGVSSKIGYKLLNKVYGDEGSAIVRNEEFEGRVRRYRYRSANKNSDGVSPCKEVAGVPEAGSYITVEERIRAIKELMSGSPVLQLNRQTYEGLQEITGWKYRFDRRTIIRAARLAGFNVHKTEHKASSGCRYVIAEPGISKDDPRLQNLPVTEPEIRMSRFQRKIYNTFVNSPKFVEVDNGYISSKIERLKRFCTFIFRYMDSEHLESLTFDWEVIKKINFDLLLAVIPFSRMGFRFSLCALISGDGEHEDMPLQKPQEEPNLLCMEQDALSLPNNGDLDLNVLKTSNIGSLMNKEMSSAIQKLVRSKVSISSFASMFRYLGEASILDLDISPERILIRKVLMDEDMAINALEKLKSPKRTRKYPSLDKRTSFFKEIYKTEERCFYDEAYRVIYRDFNGEEFESMLDRLKVFRVKSVEGMSTTCTQQDSLEKLYMHFKRKIIEQGWLGELDFDAYSVLEAKKVLRKLSRDRVIANYKNIRRIEFVTPHERFRRMIGRRYDMSHFQGYQKYKNTGYFSHYFDSVYYILATSGSLEIEDLISKAKVLAPFEMELFLSEYKDVFEVSENDGTRIVSLKMVMDPFEGL